MKLRLRSKFTGALAIAMATGGLAAAVTGAETVGAASVDSTMVCHDGVYDGNDNSVTFELEAVQGYIELPDGNTVYTWSYAEKGNQFGFQFPGPTLCADQGETVRVKLTKPALTGSTFGGGVPASATSIVFPGQTGVTATGGVAGLLTQEVETDLDEVIYEFVANAPGTYLYESGTDSAVQVQMGMFGGLVIYPTEGRHMAYSGHAFDAEHEYLLIFHEMDPSLHVGVELNVLAGGSGDAAVLADYEPLTRHSRYWTINGRAFPDTIAENNTPLLPFQPYGALVQINADDPNDGYTQLPGLVRYGNAGLDNHAFHPHGDHLTLIAKDARLLPDEIEAYTETVAAGQTYDILAGWEDVEAWQGTGDVPTAINLPALNNLVYKDGVTFYSGSPELGVEQQLPADVTTFTQCGEYYFPWHSHALQEVQNFDEGFGGMLTLWRVDPPKVPDGGGGWMTPLDCQ